MKRAILSLILFIIPLLVKAQNLKGRWQVISTAILVTSDIEDKEELYKSCLGKNMAIANDKIYLSSNCLFKEKIIGRLLNDTTILSFDQFIEDYDGSSRLVALLGLNKEYNTRIKVIHVDFNDEDGIAGKFDLILVNKMTIALLYDPYVLIFGSCP